MTLNHENMQTDATGNIFDQEAIEKDIATMDATQLDRYVRMAFTGRHDEEFLPQPFWTEYFDISSYGRLEDGHYPPSPSSFFASLYAHFGKEGATIAQKESREHLEGIFLGIIDECIQLDSPDRDHVFLAGLTIDAVEQIKMMDGPDSPTNQLVRYLERKASQEPIPIAKVEDFLDSSVTYPDIESNLLYKIADELGRKYDALLAPNSDNNKSV